MSRSQHDRTISHFGTESDLVELLTGAVGTLPAGTDLHTALAYIHAWISSLETVSPSIRYLTLDAFIAAAAGHSFTLDSILRRAISGSFTADAIKRQIVTSSFTADAVKRQSISGSFTDDAVIKRNQAASFLIDAIKRRNVSGSFTADAVLAVGGGAGSFTEDAIIRRIISASFTGDAVIAASGLTTLQWRSFDGSFNGDNAIPNSPPNIQFYNRDHFR